MSAPDKTPEDQPVEPAPTKPKPKAGSAEALKEAIKKREQESRDPTVKVKRMRK